MQRPRKELAKQEEHKDRDSSEHMMARPARTRPMIGRMIGRLPGWLKPRE